MKARRVRGHRDVW